MIIDRHLFGDLSLAVLLALPLAALAHPQPLHLKAVAAPVAAQVATAEHSPGAGRISLLG